MYFSYCIESCDFIHVFLTAQLNRTLIKKKITDMKDKQNVQNIRKFDFKAYFYIEWVKSTL